MKSNVKNFEKIKKTKVILSISIGIVGFVVKNLNVKLN